MAKMHNLTKKQAPLAGCLRIGFDEVNDYS